MHNGAQDTIKNVVIFNDFDGRYKEAKISN